MAEKSKEETVLNIQEVYTKTEMFVEKNRKPLYIALGAIAVVFAGFFAYQYLIVQPKEHDANNSLWTAEQWFELDSLDFALNGDGESEGFEGIIANYGGTKAAMRAHYFAGVIARDKGEFDAAIEHFKESDFNDEAVGVLALGNVGDCYIQNGNVEEGASWLDKAAKSASKIKSRNYLAPYFLLKASKAYMELGKNDKAKSMLQQLTDDYDSRSQEYGEAEKLLAMLKAQN